MTVRLVTSFKFLFAALIAIGCATQSDEDDARWTAEQHADYEQCLHDSMAVAMAWEAIEQSCQDKVELQADPLGLQMHDD